MDRLTEVQHKHDRLKALLEAGKADALWIQRTRNIAWLTAGADASIPLNSETGMYSLIVTPEKRIVYTDNIELTRLQAEDKLQDLGFEYAPVDWYAPPVEPRGYGKLISDLAPEIESEVQAQRWVMTEGEKVRYRELGRDTAEALEAAARAVKPGDSEFKIAGRIAAECLDRGAVAIVNLVGVDERISKFRHPLPTMTEVKRVAMLIVCMRREGLIAAATRFVDFGDEGLHEKIVRVAHVDATAIAASRPGRTLGAAFADIQAAYAEVGEDGQWKYHHQGGLIGYIGRERLARPNDETVIQAGQVFAWNPSIVGAKSEDTVMVSDTGYEVLTDSGEWPQVEVSVNGQVFQRPSILRL